MAAPREESSLSPFATTLGELMRPNVRTVPAELSVLEAARSMGEAGVGSLVVADDDGEPIGIVTKTDLVERVLAVGRDPATPVREVLTAGLHCVEQDRPLFDGLLVMLQHDIGHVVVTQDGRLAGMLSERDWLTFQERHPAALLRHFEHAGSVEELAALRRKANRLVRDLFAREGTAAALTALVTEINDRLTRRVIELGLADLAAEGHGEPPAPFAWLGMGSEGRGEQTLSTDQDNGLVYQAQGVDLAERKRLQSWFLRLAERVVASLEVCGFPLCKGNVMASNPELCLSLDGWEHKFAGYLAEPDPVALLRVSMYFDFRGLYGDPALVEALWAGLLARLQHSRGFLRHLAGHVMAGRPPIHGMGWRTRSLLRMDHPPVDLKQQALAPIVACLRVLGLDAGTQRTNSLERMQAAVAAGLLDEQRAPAVETAYDFLMLLRLRLHFRQEAQGEEPHNRLVLEDLNRLQRRFLEEALETVMDLQDQVHHQYAGISYL